MIDTPIIMMSTIILQRIEIIIYQNIRRDIEHIKKIEGPERILKTYK